MLNQFLSIEWISALGWTVLHSIWQITLIAIVVKLLMLGLSKKSPQLRYAIGIGALFSICVTTVVTFYQVFESNFTENTIVFDQVIPTNIQLILSPEATDIGSSIFGKISSFLEGHLSLIVGIWSLGFVLFLLKMLSGFYFIEKLKTNGHYPIDITFQNKLQILSKRMGIHQSVKLVESSLAKTPMMLGCFKPLILLPLHLTTGLDDKMIEAIIAHELAHIKRNDFVVNIFQSFVESLFYFHPAVWWISNQVREEREKCCDDLAIKACNDSLTYAKSLLHIQTMALNQDNFALSFTGKNEKHLLNRVKRILNQTQQNSNFMEKIISLILLIVAFIGMSFGFHSDKKAEAYVNDSAPLMSTIASIETSFVNEPSDETTTVKQNKDKRVVKTVIDDQIVYAKLENNEVKKLKIDGNKIAKEDYRNYSSIIEQLKSIGQPITTTTMVFPNIPNSPSVIIAGNDEIILLPPPPPNSPTPIEGPNPVPTPNPAPSPMPSPKTIKVIVPPMPPQTPEAMSTIIHTNTDSTKFIMGNDADVSVIEIIEGIVYINGEKVEGDQKIIVSNQNSLDQEAMLKEALKGLEEIDMDNIEIQKEAMKMADIKIIEIEKIKAEAMRKSDQMTEELYIEQLKLQEERRLEHNTNTLINAIEISLLEDGLIDNINRYSFSLKIDKLKINGKRQSKTVLKKYLSIYESISGNRIESGQQFSVNKN